MKARKSGLILFWIGVGYMFVVSWLIMWWVTPVWRNSPDPIEQFEGTLWAYEGPIFMLIAFSVPIGIALATIGMLIYGRSEKGRLWPFVIGLPAISLSLLFPSTLRYYPSVFGILGGMIYLFFFACLWFWAQNRKTLQGKAGTAADLQLISYVFFLLTASLGCSLLGNPYSGLYFPEKVLQYESLPVYYCMGMKMALYFVLGWFFIFLSHYTRYKGGCENQIDSA